MFICKSISLANYLIVNGSNIIKVDKDRESDGYLVFLFEKTDLLNTNLTKWMKITNK